MLKELNEYHNVTRMPLIQRLTIRGGTGHLQHIKPWSLAMNINGIYGSESCSSSELKLTMLK